VILAASTSLSNSSGFVVQVVVCAVLAIGLWASCVGVGWPMLPRGGASADDTPSWRQPGVAACVGLSVLLVLGGIAVLLRLPWWLVVAPFMVL
jgi:hypothetical protein